MQKSLVRGFLYCIFNFFSSCAQGKFSFIQYGDISSLLGSNLASNNDYLTSGANGYSKYGGLVQIFGSVNGTLALRETIFPPSTLASSNFNIFENSINFGVSIGISEVGNNIIVGATGYALNAGKVFIYRYLNGHWSLHSELNSPVQEIGHGFGFAVDISDIFAAVGTTANRVYIFRLQDDFWRLVKTLIVSAENESSFGTALSLYNSTLAVGDHGTGLSTGSIYLFSISEDQDGEVTVSRQATIIPEEGSCGYFGKSLQLRNQRLIIGAPGRILEEFVSSNVSVSECGAAFIFESVNGSWTSVANISSPVPVGSLFGSSVSIFDDFAVVGAYGYENSSGCAFSYMRDPVTAEWTIKDSFLPPSPQNGSSFGYSVGAGPFGFAIGAFAQDNLNGAVYISTISNTVQPTPEPTFPSPKTHPQDMAGPQGAAISVTALTVFILGALFIIVLAATVFCCCCCRSLCFPVAAKKDDKEKKLNERYSIEYVAGPRATAGDLDEEHIILMPGSRIPSNDSSAGNEFAVAEIEETDFFVQGAGPITTSIPPLATASGGDDGLQFFHNHFVSSAAEPSRPNTVDKSYATYLRYGMQQQQAPLTQPVQTSGSVYKQQESVYPLHPKSSKPLVQRLSNAVVSPFSSFSAHRSQSGDMSNISSLSSSNLSFSDDRINPNPNPPYQASKDDILRSKSIPELGNRHSIADEEFPRKTSPKAPPMFTVSKAEAGFVLQDSHRSNSSATSPLPPLSPMIRRDSSKTPPTNNSPLRTVPLPNSIPGSPLSGGTPPTHPSTLTATPPTPLEVGLYEDYKKAKSLYQIFRKEAKAQIEFQIDNSMNSSICSSEFDDFSNDGDRTNRFIEDDITSPSPSPAPFRMAATTLSDSQTPSSASPKSGVLKLPYTPPISAPEINYFTTSPQEKEIHTQLRTETKARYLQFKSHVGTLLNDSSVSPSISSSANKSKVKVKARKTDFEAYTSTIMGSPATVPSVDSPVGSHNTSIQSIQSAISMAENELRALTFQQQYPAEEGDVVPMQTNSLRYSEYREHYPQLETTTVKHEVNMMRHSMKKLPNAKPSAALPTDDSSAGGQAARDDERRRVAKANYLNYRAKFDSENN